MHPLIPSPPRAVPQWKKIPLSSTEPTDDTITPARKNVLKLISQYLKSLQAFCPNSTVSKVGQSCDTVAFKTTVTQEVKDVIDRLLPYDMPCIFEIDPTKVVMNPKTRIAVNSMALTTIFKDSKSKGMSVILPIGHGYVLVQLVKIGMLETYSLHRSVPGFSCNEENVPKASSLKTSFQHYNVLPENVLKEMRAKMFDIVSDHIFIAALQTFLSKNNHAEDVAKRSRNAKDEFMSWVQALISTMENRLEDTNANKLLVNQARLALNDLLPGNIDRTLEQIQCLFKALQNLLLKATEATEATEAYTMNMDKIEEKLRLLTRSTLHAHRMAQSLGEGAVHKVKSIEAYEATTKKHEKDIARCRDSSVTILTQFMLKKVYQTSEVYSDPTKPMPSDVIACLTCDKDTKLYEPLKSLLTLLERKIGEIGKSFDNAKALRQLDVFKKLPRNETSMKKDTLITLAQQVIDEADQKEMVVSMTKELEKLRRSAQVKESGVFGKLKKYFDDTAKLEEFNQKATIVKTNIEKIRSYQSAQIRVIEGLYMLCGGETPLSAQIEDARRLGAFISHCCRCVEFINNDCFAIQGQGDLAAMLAREEPAGSVIQHLCRLTWICRNDSKVIESLVLLASIPASILSNKAYQPYPTELKIFADSFVSHRTRDHREQLDLLMNRFNTLSNQIDR